MKNMSKKIVAILLTMCILLSGMVTVFATTGTSDDYAIFTDGVTGDIYFHNYDWSTLSENPIPVGDYKVEMDVYALSAGELAFKPHNSGWGATGDQIKWSPTNDDLNKWVTATFEGTTTGLGEINQVMIGSGFNGYIDNIRLTVGGNELYELSFSSSDNGKTGHESGRGAVVALPKDIADAKAPAVELSDDYAIYQDSSSAPTNYDTYFHLYDYSTYNDAAKEVPAGEYTVTMNVYAQSIGTIAYKPITGGWADAGEQLYWTPTEDDLNKWVTVTYTGTTTDIAKLHTLIYVQGFKGYVDDITVYSGDTEIYKLSFTESDNGKAGHDSNGAGVVTAIPKNIADAKPTEEPAPTGDYVVLLDNSANDGFGQFYLHEVGMPHDKTYPIGDYTVKFDYYPLVNGSSKNIVAHLTATGWSGDAFPGTNGQKWVEVTETLGEWQTISFDITTIAEGQFPWFYVGAGMKGYFDNYQIIDKSTGETVLDFSPVAADLGKTSKDTATVVEFEEFVEPDCVVLLDNSANTGFGQFYLHEVGMPHDKTYPIGDYTVKFDYYPIVNGSSKNIVAHLTATGWSGDAFPGTNGQKWVEVTETLGEWQTISFDITTIAEGQFPWFYVGAGMKGYFDNYQIIDKSTGETVLDFSPRLADVGKTSKDIATVVEFEEVHIHKAGDVVLENVVDATCKDAGTYDEVVYCTECGEEISRNTVTNDFLLVDTTALDNGTPKDFWFNTLGMKAFDALPNGTYTIQFDVCPITMPTGGNLFHYRTGSGSGPSSDAGWWKPDLTVGEWSTTSNTFTVADGKTTGNHIFFVYGGFKGYVDNFVILDSEGNKVAGTYTNINGLTVPEAHTEYLTITNKYEHVAGEAVRENVVDATCKAEGSYDEVVYCTECKAELSRTPNTIDKLDHTAGTAVRENVVDATCTAEGTYDEVVYCSVEGCGAEISRTPKTIDKLDHTAGTAVRENVVDATCKAEGSYDEVVYCSVCNTELSRTSKTTPIADHTITFVEEVPATVESTGVREHYTCTVCDKLFLDAEATTEVSADDLVIEKLPAPKAPIVFAIDDIEAYVGKEFDVAIYVKENSGIISAKLDVLYDTSIFEVVKVTPGDFAKTTTSDGSDVDCYFFGDTATSPLVINWCDPVNSNVTTTGTFAVITFRVKDGAVAGNSPIEITYDADNIFDDEYNNVPVEVINAVVSVKEGMLGDENGDGEVNNKDIALLMQYINGWDVEIDLTVADVNNDGKINNKDIVILTRFINGWEVVLG